MQKGTCDKEDSDFQIVINKEKNTPIIQGKTDIKKVSTDKKVKKLSLGEPVAKVFRRVL